MKVEDIQEGRWYRGHDGVCRVVISDMSVTCSSLFVEVSTDWFGGYSSIVSRKFFAAWAIEEVGPQAGRGRRER